jgi:fructosamine-3-kinase
MTSIPPAIRQHVLEVLTEYANQITLLDFSFTSGGCISHGGKLQTSAGDFFLKWNDARRYPGMFKAEAAGLKLLKQNSTVHIPEVIGWFEEGEHQGIVLEFVESKQKQPSYWQDLGIQLAGIHNVSAPEFGLDHDNYIGSLPQSNSLYKNWIDFFIEERLKAQVRLAVDARRLDQNMIGRFELLYSKLPELLPETKPSLLHGDLWSGNLITNSKGDPCLIDPAVHFGHREAEISFTRLFGGFEEIFYDAYNDVFPLTKDFHQRVDIYNLYPLLVHVNLFGGGYASQVKSILQNFY